MNIHIATVDTRNFTFEAYGIDTDSALKALESALVAHRNQMSGRVSADWPKATLEQANTRIVKTGVGYRDREAVLSPLESAIAAANVELVRMWDTPLDTEQVECLNDPQSYDEALEMLDDLEARCGLSGEARGELADALTQRQLAIEKGE